ncbi:MAG: cyclic nucleotide-binding domain-containing protein [Bacteroidota bacterium]
MLYKAISESLVAIGGFTEQEISLITNRLETKRIEKDQFVLQHGEICQSVLFVKSGTLHQYKMVGDMDQLMLNLYPENSWVMDHKSFTSQKPSENYIQATEDSKVQELTMNTIHELISQTPSFFKLGKILDLVQHDQHGIDHLKSPEEKYLKLLDTRPELLQKFPLKSIASYLRMTPETLSRVRRKIV